MQLREIGLSERQRWNDFTAAAEVADVLQSYEWGELKGTFGWVPHRLLFERKGVPVAAASVLERRLRPVGRSLFYCSRGPILDYSDSGLLREVLGQLRDYCRARNGFMLKIDPAVELARGAPVDASLSGSGFRKIPDEGGFGGTQPRCVMKLDLTPTLDAVLAGCKPKARYNIRLAGRKGVEVRDDCGDSELGSFYDLLKVTTARDGFVVRSLAYFRKLWETLAPAGYARLAMAYYEREPIAGALVTRFGNTCCYLYGASADEHRNRMPNHLVQWRLIEKAKAEGCTVYDFRGVSSNPDAEDHLSGLNRFKSGFGATFVEYVGEYDLPLTRLPYYVWTVARPAAVRLLKRARQTATAPAD